jgi:hypothetical protein
MFDYDSTRRELQEILDELYERLEDLIPGTPQYREQMEDISELERLVDSSQFDDVDLDEMIDAARQTGSAEDWQKVREIYDQIAGGNLSGLSIEDVSDEAREIILSQR